QKALESILGSSWRIWLGGWTAYMVSQYVDLWSFLKLKQLPLGRASLPFRAWTSMVLGQLLDTIIFLTIAFYETEPISSVIPTVFHQSHHSNDHNAICLVSGRARAKLHRGCASPHQSGSG